MSVQEKIKAQIDNLYDKIDELGQKVGKNMVVRNSYQKTLENMKKKQEVLKRKWEEVKDKGEDVWLSVKDEFTKGINDLSQEFDNVKSRFRI